MVLKIFHICFVPLHGTLKSNASLGTSDDPLLNLRLIICCFCSWYKATWTFELVRSSARYCELLKKPMFLISCDLYACRAKYMSSIIRFSLVRLSFDMMSNKRLESVDICTGINSLKTNSNCLWIESASLNKPAKAITPADNTVYATRRDLYDL